MLGGRKPGTCDSVSTCQWCDYIRWVGDAFLPRMETGRGSGRKTKTNHRLEIRTKAMHKRLVKARTDGQGPQGAAHPVPQRQPERAAARPSCITRLVMLPTRRREPLGRSCVGGFAATMPGSQPRRKTGKKVSGARQLPCDTFGSVLRIKPSGCRLESTKKCCSG